MVSKYNGHFGLDGGYRGLTFTVVNTDAEKISGYMDIEFYMVG